jgi:hypothetical protein
MTGHLTTSRFGKVALAIGVALAVILAAGATRSEAKSPILFFESSASTSHAGAHGDAGIYLKVGTRYTEPPKLPCFCNTVRDITVNTPAGLIAAPQNIPQCTSVELARKQCPVDSQVGLLVVPLFGYEILPLYNMQAPVGKLAQLAALQPLVAKPISIGIADRTESDYGLEFKTIGISNLIPPEYVVQQNWGVPADPVHDSLRFPYGETQLSCDKNPIAEVFANEFPIGKCSESFGTFEGGKVKGTPANSPATPFVQNPTACTGPLEMTAETLAYDLETDRVSTTYPAMTACDQLTFNPSLSAKPTTEDADSPTGLDVNLTVPQTISPDSPVPSAIRDVYLELPEGLTVNPNAADGKFSCTAGQAKIGTRLQAECPDFSKVGSLGVKSSSFPEVLPGSVYLGEPLPGDRYRLFLVADGFSLHVKLPGTAIIDRATGQITVSFKDLPQFNFEEFDVHVFGAERGLLATPERCGTYAVKTTFVPWATPGVPEQTSTQFFDINSGPNGTPCPPSARPFSPQLEAGVTDNTGGSHTNFVFDVKRQDGEQNLDKVTVSTPPGFSAVLAGIPYCPDATLAELMQSSYLGMTELGSARCVASQIGTSLASAGTGSKPFSLPGRVYLAGPYNGAPLSLAVVTPAVSGPYDLGNVVVRVAVRVNPTTAQVTAVADPLPQIIEGIPLRLRRVLVMLDKPGFAVNPTNCDPFSVATEITGDEGAVSHLSQHFQVANCSGLKYSPKVEITLRGGLNRLGHPAINAVFSQVFGEANSSSVSVTLPKGELLDNSHIGTVCTRPAFASDSCPPGSLIGTATASSPLLDQPLEGPIYLRSSSNELPDMVFDLEGQIDVEASARIDSVKSRLRASFENIPDVPLGRVTVSLMGGSRGLLQNSSSLCGTKKRAVVRVAGQNGANLSLRPTLIARCTKAQRVRRHNHSTRKAG